MNKNLVTPACARLTARSLFLLLHRDQGKWFDLAWKHYETTASSSPTVPTSLLGSGLGVVGTEGEVTQTMARQFADLAATFLINSPMARHELLARLQNKLASSNRPDALVTWLVQSAKATLDQHSTDDKIIVNQLHNGKLTQNQICDPIDFEAVLKTNRYDIVVNELIHFISVKDRAGIIPTEITKVATMQRGMLWLVFTKVGGLLKHQQIGDLFDFDATEPSFSSNRKDRVVGKIYQYPVALREMVGEDLFRRMMDSGASRSNAIPQKGWSFCWGRTCQNERESELLHGLLETARWSEGTT